VSSSGFDVIKFCLVESPLAAYIDSQGNRFEDGLKREDTMTEISEVLRQKRSSALYCATLDMTVVEAADMMHRHKIGALVCRDDQEHLVGIFSERDIVRGLSENPNRLEDMRVGDLASTHVVTCAPDDDVKGVISLMGIGGFRHMPVVTDGQVIDIISITDIFRHFATKSPEDRAAILEAYANASPPGS